MPGFHIHLEVILKSSKFLGLFLLFIFTLLQGRAQSETGLFSRNEILDLELKMDVRTVLKDVGEDRVYHPATLSYIDSVGDKVWLSLKVKTRGNMRRNPEVCTFPPIWPNFKKKGTLGSIFEGHNKIKLVTHCKEIVEYRQNVFKEYLIYKQYNQLTEKSNRVRLSRIIYIDLQGEKTTANICRTSGTH